MSSATKPEDNGCVTRHQTYGAYGLDQCDLANLPAIFQQDVYTRLYASIKASRPSQYRVLVDAASSSEEGYEQLVSVAREFLSRNPDYRLLLTLPDGTVLFDSARADGTATAQDNSFQNFQAKTINENHNTRVAIMYAQLSPLGLGWERKLSTSTEEVETYVAMRLGPQFASSGTMRLSISTGLL